MIRGSHINIVKARSRSTPELGPSKRDVSNGQRKQLDQAAAGKGSVN